MSITGKRKSTIGLGHDGAPKPGAFVPLDHPQAMGSHPHAIAARNQAGGMIDQTNVHAALGKAPKPKRAHVAVPPIAGGMVARSRRDGVHFHNISGQDLSRLDANPGDDPLRAAPRGKSLTPPIPVIGQRSRSRAVGDLSTLQELGAAMLREAFAASSPDDRTAYGYGIRHDVPDAVSEE